MMRELGIDLARRGWDVTVVTGFPNHPGGEVFAGYKKAWFQEEITDGLRLWRVFLFTSPTRSPARRLATFISYTLTSSWAILRRGDPDLIFAVFQPLSVGLVLPLVARLKHARLVLNIQDLHPDAPIELGLVRNPFFIRVLRAIETFGYKAADGLSVISESFRQHCLTKGCSPKNVAVIENWIDLDEIRPGDRLNQFRREAGLADDDFVVLYAGTIGLISGAEVLVRAAQFLRDQPHIKFLFVGDGPLLECLKSEVRDRGLESVAFMPFQSRARLREVQATADLSVISLLKNRGRTSVPSKVLGYMAAGRAVIGCVDSESDTAQLIRNSAGGVLVPPEDPAALAAAIRKLERDPKMLSQMGLSGRRYLEEHFSRGTITEKYQKFFCQVAGSAC
jgi:colanic acid biosynthesis glycosyl transferase WcaI